MNWPFMHRAIEVAAGRQPHPNPSVGAVVVSPAGDIVGEGNHAGPGQDHAEVVALNQAGEAALGADLYVTLEPCSFHGHTRPCVDAVKEAGVDRVFVGAIDPDVRVSGTGVKKLLQGGVKVMIWEDTAEAEAVDPAYFHHRRTGRARITLKYAMTLDGSVAAADGSSQWITSEEARHDAHLLRAAADAILVGAGTLRDDDPRLDVRIDEFNGRQPRPVIVAGNRPLPMGARVWERDPIVLATSKVEIPAGELIEVPGEDFPDAVAVARTLGDRGYLECLLEGGSRLSSAWWKAGVIDRWVVYIGAKVGGGVGRPPLDGVFESVDLAETLDLVDVRTLGPDVRIEFR